MGGVTGKVSQGGGGMASWIVHQFTGAKGYFINLNEKTFRQESHLCGFDRQLCHSGDEVHHSSYFRQCGSLLTMHLGPEDILVNIDVESVDGLSTDEVETAIARIEERVKEAVPAATKIYIEAQALKRKTV